MDLILLPSSISPYLNGYLFKQSERTMMESGKRHCCLRVNLVTTGMTPRSLSAKLLWSWVSPSQCWCLELFLPRCRTLHFPLLHEVHVSSFLQPCQVPLDGSRTLWCISLLSQLSVSRRLDEHTLSSIISLLFWKYQRESRLTFSNQAFHCSRSPLALP